jgi:hypothetical protein
MALGVAALAGGCGGGGGGGGGGTPQGTFSDSPVAGLGYVTGSQSGETGADGGFRYDQEGDRITFSIGDIEIGNGDVAGFMTPVNLVLDEDPDASERHEWVVNIARFLQTLDNDADPANGIRITSAVRAAAAGLVVEFAQPGVAFENDVAVQAAVASLTAATTAGPRGLVPADEAREHLRQTLVAKLFAGRYRGTLNDGATTSGTWTVTVSTAGAVTVACVLSGRGACSGPGLLSGAGELRGNGEVEATGPGPFLYLQGQITDGSVAGLWFLFRDRYGDGILDHGSFVGQLDGG